MPRKNSSISYVIFLITVLVATACCCTQKSDKKNDVDSHDLYQLRNELDRQKNEIRSIAKECGIPDDTIKSYSATGLLSEISSHIESMNYRGQVLSSEDMSYIDEMLSDEPEIIKTIHNYQTFIKNKKRKTE